MPSGTPKIAPTAPATEACHATAASSCRLLNPSVRSNARSRRPRFTDATNVNPSATTAPIARASGEWISHEFVGLLWIGHTTTNKCDTVFAEVFVNETPGRSDSSVGQRFGKFGKYWQATRRASMGFSWWNRVLRVTHWLQAPDFDPCGSFTENLSHRSAPVEEVSLRIRVVPAREAVNLRGNRPRTLVGSPGGMSIGARPR